MLARTVVLLVISLFAVQTFGCSSETGAANYKNTTLEKITNESGIYSIEDFKNTGFKVVKEYDVSELEDSTGA